MAKMAKAPSEEDFSLMRTRIEQNEKAQGLATRHVAELDKRMKLLKQ